MRDSTRRCFLGSAVSAALASVLSIQSRAAAKTPKRSLIADFVGPMAFRHEGPIFNVWMPKLDKTGDKHQAGINTSVTSHELTNGDYAITGPTAFGGDPPYHYTSSCQVYQAQPNDYSAADRYIRLAVPTPNSIVALQPVSAQIYPTNAPPSTSSYAGYAVGLRFIYLDPGTPTLSNAGPIPFDPGDDETELILSVGYAPYVYDSKSLGHAEAKYAFNQLSKLFPNLDLQVDFDPSVTGSMEKARASKQKAQWVNFGGPLQDCKAPIILLI